MSRLDVAIVREAVGRALAEDRAREDVTSHATIPGAARGRAALIAREGCVIAGMDCFEEAFRALDDGVVVERHADDGNAVDAGARVASVEGALRSILAAERTALNFVQRLSGIATFTRRFVDAVQGRARVLDTRKTTPGLRALEKAAVAAGGGTNHRMDLASAVLIKDNHVAAAGGIAPAVEAVRRHAPGLPIEVECDSLQQVREAVALGVDAILLDNMSVEQLAEAVRAVAGRARTEASGGITLSSISTVAATGVDDISVGALTHSASAVDLALDLGPA